MESRKPNPQSPPPMDFHFRAADDWGSSSLSDGYFALQAFRAGFLGSGGVHGLSEREAIEREILKERIREEILAREMAQRRILEEEVRMELEMERIMELKRLQMERLSALSGGKGMVMRGERAVRCVMPLFPEGRIGEPFGQGAAEVAFGERSPSRLIKKETESGLEEPSLPNKLEKASASSKTTSNYKLSGAKRKASGELLQLSEKQWGCVLCEVSVNSEEDLQVHLQGKRHKENAALLSFNKASPKKTDSLQLKKNVTCSVEVRSASGPMNKKHVEGKKQKFVWCNLCRVKCNSPVMMEFHLAGKKHKASLELKKVGNSPQVKAVNGVSNEISGDNVKDGFVEEDVDTADLTVESGTIGVAAAGTTYG